MGSGKGNKALIRWYVGWVPCLGFRLKSNLHLLDPHLLPPLPFPTLPNPVPLLFWTRGLQDSFIGVYGRY